DSRRSAGGRHAPDAGVGPVGPAGRVRRLLPGNYPAVRPRHRGADAAGAVLSEAEMARRLRAVHAAPGRAAARQPGRHFADAGRVLAGPRPAAGHGSFAERLPRGGAGGAAGRAGALRLAAAQLAARDDWDDEVKTFPEVLHGDLYLELAERWGTENPAAAFRAFRRGLKLKPDAWPGQALADVALAYARGLASHDHDAAMSALTWAATHADDPRLEAEAAAIALEAGAKDEALALSRRVFQRRPDDLDNLGRLAGLQADAGAWGEVAALAPAIIAAVSRLNPWQREDYVPVVELALEAWLRAGQAAQAEAALDQIHLDDGWWRRRGRRAAAAAPGSGAGAAGRGGRYRSKNMLNATYTSSSAKARFSHSSVTAEAMRAPMAAPATAPTMTNTASPSCRLP